jgi:hypothetical protein
MCSLPDIVVTFALAVAHTGADYIPVLRGICSSADKESAVPAQEFQPGVTPQERVTMVKFG